MGLVRPILLKRLNNEIENLNRYLNLNLDDIPEDVVFPITLSICLTNTPARVSRCEETKIHGFDLTISDEYPFERPRVMWKTKIFHPNIMMPEDGGQVCLRILEYWSFGSNLISFVIGIENLLIHPNCSNPYGTESCVAAARWYSANKPKFSAEINYGGSDA